MLSVIIAVFLAAFGLKGFLLPNHFIDGGVTGISILLSFVSHQPIGLFLVLVNIPFVILAWFYLGRKNAIYSTLSIIALSLLLTFVDFPIVTTDKLLCSVFGGMFLGAGIGLAIRGQSVLDGTEVLAYIISRKTAFTVGNIITIINVVIFLGAIFVIGVEASLYSILTYVCGAKSMDYILYGFEEYYAVIVVSPKYKEIKEKIYQRMERGVTIFQGEGGYRNGQHRILYCVVTKLEITTFKSVMEEIDPQAFVSIFLLKDAYGGLTKKKFTSMGHHKKLKHTQIPSL